MRRPLCIDGFCGLGGWAEGFLAEGWDVVGFDVEQHIYGHHRYPGQLVIQDVLTLHGSQFQDADCLVFSPPCQEYSYMAMPWTLAKAKAAAIRADTTGAELARLNRLFDACFRIQKETSGAAGKYIPIVVENVRGAQPWVGRARWNYGSFYLWGDVPALMPNAIRGWKGVGPAWDADSGHSKIGMTRATNPAEAYKSQGLNWSDQSKRGQDFTRRAGNHAIKNNGGSWFGIAHNTTSGTGRNPDGRKVPGGGTDGWFGPNGEHPLLVGSSDSLRRKVASAMIAKIPFPLARHIATVFRP